VGLEQLQLFCNAVFVLINWLKLHCLKRPKRRLLSSILLDTQFVLFEAQAASLFIFVLQ
jgi:hypothetical protein